MNENEEENGNVDTSGIWVGKPGSMDDVSEYTDADESLSAPTEILAEFLSSIMIKDYPSALKYCKLILQYEPNHATAKEFFPLLFEKCNQNNSNNNKEDNGNNASDSDDETDCMSDDTNDFDDEIADDDENSKSNDESDEESSITSSPEEGKRNGDVNLTERDLSSSGTQSELELGGTTTSYSSLDEDAEIQYDQMNDGSTTNSSKENSHCTSLSNRKE